MGPYIKLKPLIAGSPMKIALVSREYTSRGGVEKISQYYARTLVRRGHEVHVWCSKREDDQRDSGITFHELKTFSRGAAHVIVFPTLVRLFLKPSEYDAVVVMGVSGLVDNAFIVMNSVHQHWFNYSLKQTKFFSLPFFRKIFNIRHYAVMWVEKNQFKNRTYRKAIAVSEPIKAELKRWYNVAESSLCVLPNGADHHTLKPDHNTRAKTRAELGMQSDHFLFCMLANEVERKGVRQTMQALHQIGDKNIKLLIVGRLNHARCEQIAQELAVTELVILKPSTKDVSRYLWASDAYILPTQYEAWNLSIMEAQAAGLPVITTKLGQADLVVENEKSGLLIENPLDVAEIVNAIKRLRAEPDLTSMRLNARERAEKYSWENLVTQLENIISEDQRQSGKVSLAAEHAMAGR